MLIADEDLSSRIIIWSFYFFGTLQEETHEQ